MCEVTFDLMKALDYAFSKDRILLNTDSDLMANMYYIELLKEAHGACLWLLWNGTEANL
jgi:hypothetical protein